MAGQAASPCRSTHGDGLTRSWTAARLGCVGCRPAQSRRRLRHPSITSPSSGGEGPMQSGEAPSLYDRLGGVYNIATVIDDLIDRVMTDPRLNKNPAVDEAHHRVSPAGFKFLVTEMVCG